MNPVILLSGGTSAAANGTPAWSLEPELCRIISAV